MKVPFKFLFFIVLFLPAVSLDASADKYKKLVRLSNEVATLFYLMDQPERAIKIVEFPLALDPKNKRAVIIKEKIKRELDIDSEVDEAVLKEFSRELLRASKKSKDLNFKALCHLLVIEMEPKNEESKINLMSFVNKQNQLDFLNLISKVKEKKKLPLRRNKPINKSLAELLALKATEHASHNSQNSIVSTLLKAAIAFNAENQTALLLQGNIYFEHKISYSDTPITDSEIIDKLIKFAQRSKKKRHLKLLCYKLVQTIDPSNDEALYAISIEEENSGEVPIEKLFQKISKDQVRINAKEKAEPKKPNQKKENKENKRNKEFIELLETSGDLLLQSGEGKKFKDGVIHVSRLADGGFAYRSDVALLGDYTIEVELQIIELGSEGYTPMVGITYGRSASRDHSYTLAGLSAFQGLLQVGIMSDGKASTVMSCPLLKINFSKKHKLKLEVKDDKIAYSINGRTVMTGEGDFDGGIGIYAQNANVQFSSIRYKN